MVKVVCIGKYNIIGKFDSLQWVETLTGLSNICDCIIIYTKLSYEAVKDMFDKYCKVKKLKSPDSLLKIKAYKLIIMQKEAWYVIRGCNFDINSIRAISHMYFFAKNVYIGSLEIEDYENYILLELCADDLNEIESQMSCLLKNQEICIHHKEDVSALVGNDEWKALGC